VATFATGLLLGTQHCSSDLLDSVHCRKIQPRFESQNAVW